MSTHKFGQFSTDPLLDRQIEELVYRIDSHKHVVEDGSSIINYLLLAGRSGGQIAKGGVASGEDLTLLSTSHPTKGEVYLGGNGITDRTVIEADGTIRLDGAATTWNDINISLIPPATGPAEPAIIAVNGDASLKCYAFSGTNPTPDELSSSMEIIHDYKEGTDIIPHIHWAPTTTDIADVKWQLRYMWVNKDGTFSGATTIFATVTTSGTAWREQRTSFPSISGSGKQIGSRFLYRLFRDATDVADTYAFDAAVFDFGIHYECDTLGSRQTTTK